MAARILNYNIFVDLTAHINQWKNVLYSIWFFFLNVSQLSLTFLILFQKLCNAVRNEDVDLVQDCLHKGANLQYADDHVSGIYTM
jgi:hypothetical protein